ASRTGDEAADRCSDQRDHDDGLTPDAIRQPAEQGGAAQLGERERGDQQSHREPRRAQSFGITAEDRHDDPEPDEVERNRCPDGPVPLGYRPALSLCHDPPFYLIGRRWQHRLPRMLVYLSGTRSASRTRGRREMPESTRDTTT